LMTRRMSPPSLLQQIKLNNFKLRIGTINTQGLAYLTARGQIIEMRKKYGLDILNIQETRVNYAGTETGTLFYMLLIGSARSTHAKNRISQKQKEKMASARLTKPTRARRGRCN
jgi:hypothetical protein